MHIDPLLPGHCCAWWSGQARLKAAKRPYVFCYGLSKDTCVCAQHSAVHRAERELHMADPLGMSGQDVEYWGVVVQVC